MVSAVVVVGATPSDKHSSRLEKIATERDPPKSIETSMWANDQLDRRVKER